MAVPEEDMSKTAHGVYATDTNGSAVSKGGRESKANKGKTEKKKKRRREMTTDDDSEERQAEAKESWMDEDDVEDYNYPTVVQFGPFTLCHVRVGAVVALAVELVGCVIQIGHGAYAWNYPKHLYEIDEPATEAILKIIKPAEMLCIVIFDFLGPGLLLITILIAFGGMATSTIKLLIPHAVMQLIFTIGLITQCFIIVVTPMEYHAELINQARMFEHYIPGHVVPYHKGKLFVICFGIMCMYSVAVLLMIWFISILKHYFFYLYKELGYELPEPKNLHPVDGGVPNEDPQALSVDQLATLKQSPGSETPNPDMANGSVSVLTPSPITKASSDSSPHELDKSSYREPVIATDEDEVTRIALEPRGSIPSTPDNHRDEESTKPIKRKARGNKNKQNTTEADRSD